MKNNYRDIIIIGAGPIGLAMAAKLVILNLDFVLLEKGTSIATNVLEWKHIQLFSNWEECIDDDARSLLAQNGISLLDLSNYPTGEEILDNYLRPLSEIKKISSNLNLESCVHNIKVQNIEGEDFFELEYSHNGEQKKTNSKFVIDASGTWGNFNKVIPLNKEKKFKENLSYHIPNISAQNIEKYRDKRVLVIGSGHSAMNSLLQLLKLKAKILHWGVRKDGPKFSLGPIAEKRGSLEENIRQLLDKFKIQLHTEFGLSNILNEKTGLTAISESGKRIEGIDEIIINTGAEPDYSLVSNFDIKLDQKFLTSPNLPDKIDPELHSCGSAHYQLEDLLITDRNYYVVGMKSFGKASNFLLKSGYAVLDSLAERILHGLKTKKKHE